MSIPRSIVLDLLNRYPDAATVDDAVDAHLASLVAAEEAARSAVTRFRQDVGLESKPPAQVQPAPPKPAMSPKQEAMQWRYRGGTTTEEFLFSSRRILTTATRLKLGVLDASGRIWLTADEAAKCRVACRPGVPRTTKRSFREIRQIRNRTGSSVVERRYASGEYIAFARERNVGTLSDNSQYVWFTDEELDVVREHSRHKAIARGM